MSKSGNRGAFVDERGIRWDPNIGEIEGWLYKRSKWISQWRKRYFILKGIIEYTDLMNLRF